MRVSVIICTLNRSRSLRGVLAALRQQVFPDFEVIVVKGPCEDDTDDLLAEWRGSLRVVGNSARNLSRSRNLGINAAAGNIVAFIDDDAIPEPGWLRDLAAAYTDDRIAGAGGLVYDSTGVKLQFRHAVCDRAGRTDFQRSPPFDAYIQPGADPLLYLQGTNMSFRRTALEAVGGFDENIEYIWDDVEVALQLLDAGWTLVPLNAAAVHHKVLPSASRRGSGVATDPYAAVKDRCYFALQNGPRRRPWGHPLRRSQGPPLRRPRRAVLRTLEAYRDELREHARNLQRRHLFTAEEAEYFVARLEAGFASGTRQGSMRSVAGTSSRRRHRSRFSGFPGSSRRRARNAASVSAW